MTGNKVVWVILSTATLLSIHAEAQMKVLTPGAADNAAAITATKSAIHPMLANTPAAANYGKEGNSAEGAIAPTAPLPPGGPRYPGDLSFQGGAVVGQAQSHDVYLLNSLSGPGGCNASTIAACWGNPEGFLKDLSGSDFIHVVDQYTGEYASNRYTVGNGALVYFPNGLPSIFINNDMVAIAHAVASFYGSGYGSIYHIFLPPGTDECFNSSYSVCYSPDNPNTFYFCAYHGSANFADIGEVLFTVEPYQNVGGCNVPPGTPNGSLVDSTNNVLSHELFETITDPNGSAWWNYSSNALYGSEIGDECSFIIFPPNAVYFNPSVFRIGKKKYAVQPEYSNIGHTCATSTSDM